MTITVGNWVGEFSNTTGPGDIVFAGPIAGYTTFESIAGNNVDFWYAIVDGVNREAGVGNYNAGIFKRTTVYSTLINGSYFGSGAAPLDLSGAAEIYSTFNKTAFDEFVAHIANINIHFPDAPANGIAYNRKDNAWFVAETGGGGGGGGGGSTEIVVPQLAHGFSVLDCVRYDNPTDGYALALADNATTLALGVVVQVDSVDQFVFSMTGIYTGNHGLLEKEWYYLSDVNPGQLTNVEPDISQPIVYTQGPSDYLVYEYRASEPDDLAIFAGAGFPGIVPDPITESGRSLQDDGTWAASGGQVDSVVGGTDITVDATDPANPIVNFTGSAGGGQVDSVVGGTDITVDSTDPANPIVNFTGTSGGIPEAPEDGTPYVREDATWVAGITNLNTIDDVDVATAEQNQLLYYDAGTLTWRAKTSTSALGIIEFDFRWSTAPLTTPAAGRVSSNNANPALVTILYINELSEPGNDLSLFFDNMTAGDWININAPGNADIRNAYDVTAVPTKVGSVYQVPVSVFSVTPYLPGNNAQIALFLRFTAVVDGLPPGGLDGQMVYKVGTDDYVAEWADAPEPGGQVNTVVGGTDITVDATDPVNPIVNFTGTIPPAGGQVNTVVAGTGVTVVSTDPVNPVVSSPLAASATQPGDNLSTLTNDELFAPLTGATAFEVVAALPGSPDPNTIYFVTA